jgi:hypothetical protein
MPTQQDGWKGMSSSASSGYVLVSSDRGSSAMAAMLLLLLHSQKIWGHLNDFGKHSTDL